MGARVFTNTPMPALALSCGVGAGNKPAQADRTAIATIADRTFFVVIAASSIWPIDVMVGSPFMYVSVFWQESNRIAELAVQNGQRTRTNGARCASPAILRRWK
jgi:hypothetical protein